MHKRGKRKRPPLFNTPLRREKIDRSEEPVSASSSYSSPLRGKEHIRSPRPGCPSHTASARNRLLKVPPPSFLSNSDSLPRVWQWYTREQNPMWDTHRQCPDPGLAPLAYKQKHVPREGEGERNRKIEREREIFFIEFDAEHEKRDGISKSLLLRRPHLQSRVIVTFNLFTIAWIEYVEEEKKKKKGCLFISCKTIGRISLE